jgi:hypothetical protein
MGHFKFDGKGQLEICVALAWHAFHLCAKLHPCHASIMQMMVHVCTILTIFSANSMKNCLFLRLNHLLYYYTTISLCIYSQKITFELRPEFIGFPQCSRPIKTLPNVSMTPESSMHKLCGWIKWHKNKI